MAADALYSLGSIAFGSSLRCGACFLFVQSDVANLAVSPKIEIADHRWS